MSTKTKERELKTLPIGDVIVVDGHNPRGDFTTDDEGFAELVASIKEHGVLQPILVGPAAKDGKHPIVAGHRRFAAATKAKLKAMPAMVADLNGSGFSAAIAENVIREDMTPLQEARAIARLRDEFGMKQADVAKALGKSERWTRDRQRLLSLPEKAAERFDRGEVPLEALPELEKIAKKAPNAVDGVLACAGDGTIYGVTLDSLNTKVNIGRALERVALEAGLVKITRPLYHDRGVPLERLPISKEDRAKMKERWDAIPPAPYGGGRRGFVFDEKDAATAKRLGALLEYGRDQYISESEVIATLAARKLSAMLKAAEKRAQEASSSSGGAQSEADRKKQEEREAKKREREQEMLAGANKELRERLDGLANPKATDLEIARLVCAMALGTDDQTLALVEGGLAKLDPERYPSEEDDDGNGGSWPDDDALVRELAQAKNTGDCFRILLRAVIARRYYLTPSNGRDREPWLPIGGPTTDDLHTLDLLDDVAERLGVLPKPALAKVESRRRERKEREAAEAKLEKERSEAAQKAAESATRADKALAFLQAGMPGGMAASDLAVLMQIKPNYLYRILGDLEKEGKVTKDGRVYRLVQETTTA